VVARIRDTALRPEYTRLLAGWVGVPEAEVRSAVGAALKGAGARPAAGGRSGPGQAGTGQAGTGQGRTGQGAPHGPRDAGRAAEPTDPAAAAPGRAPRPNPRDPALFVERESLKCALQVPDLVGDWFDSVQQGSIRHPRYEEVRAAIAAAGGPAGATGQAGGQDWIDAVLEVCPDDSVRALVRELAVEPLTTAGDPQERYATSIVARLLSDEAGRRLQDLKRELGQLDQIAEAQRVAAILTDVMQLEAYRRELHRVGQEEA
jgi:DNA primase